MGKLEKFIRENRSQFDSDEPREDLWEKIREEIKTEDKIIPIKRTFNYWRVAAIILLLFSAALVFDRFVIREKNKNDEWANAFFTSEFQEAEGFYLNLVSERKAVLEEKLKNDPQSRSEFLAEIEALDVKYELLKEEIKYGNQDEILDALILNLQMRIEILNRQIEILERFNSKENEDEKATI